MGNDVGKKNSGFRLKKAALGIEAEAFQRAHVGEVPSSFWQVSP